MGRIACSTLKSGNRLENLWDDAKAAGMSEPELLLYRSNLLGSDKRITNYGGGNTSAKLAERDPLTGETVEVLWVKGSGGDVGSMKLDGFATLYLDKLEALKGLYRGVEHEDEMVGYLPHCTFDLNPRAASIDTPLHAYVPQPMSTTCTPTRSSRSRRRRTAGADARDLRRRDRLAAVAAAGVRARAEAGAVLPENPEAEGVVLESHGLFTWGDDARRPATTTRSRSSTGRSPGWSGARPRRRRSAARRHAALAPDGAAAAAARADAGDPRADRRRSVRKVGHFDDQPAVLEFVNSERLGGAGGARDLAAPTTSCAPRSGRWWSTSTRRARTSTRRSPGCRRRSRPIARTTPAYYERCRRPDSPAMRDPNAVVYLVPGVGMITFAGDKATARISGEFYVNAINVMRGLGGGLDLPRAAGAGGLRHRVLAARGGEAAADAEAEEPRRAGGARHRRRRRHRRATAARLLDEGACVVLADIDAGALGGGRRTGWRRRFGADVVRAVDDGRDRRGGGRGGVSRRRRVEFGGLDILVSNAGIASSAPIEETTLALWDRNMAILVDRLLPGHARRRSG